jgi:hypothetical protein
VPQRYYRPGGPIDRQSAAASLESRLDELRHELRWVEAALREVRKPAGEANESE